MNGYDKERFPQRQLLSTQLTPSLGFRSAGVGFKETPSLPVAEAVERIDLFDVTCPSSLADLRADAVAGLNAQVEDLAIKSLS